MRRNIDGTCSPSCCKNPNIRTINTMDADTQGNFTIRGDQGIHVTVGTNEIIISGIAVYYDNLDGNLVIDNDAMTIDFAEDIVITGDLTVNGTYYTVHAEHVYTEDDYIIMRDGAVTGLGSGQYSGFQVKLYDGVNDGRLVIDNAGVARVGDVGDEQPLLTRSESAYLTNNNLLKWDSTNMKAIDSGLDTSKVITSDSVSDYNFTSEDASATGTIRVMKFGKVVVVTIFGTVDPTSTGSKTLVSTMPTALHTIGASCHVGGTIQGFLSISGTNLYYDAFNTGVFFGELVYISSV